MVDLGLLAGGGDGHIRIPRHGEQADLFLIQIHKGHHQRIAAALFLAFPAVAAHHQNGDLTRGESGFLLFGNGGFHLILFGRTRQQGIKIGAHITDPAEKEHRADQHDNKDRRGEFTLFLTFFLFPFFLLFFAFFLFLGFFRRFHDLILEKRRFFRNLFQSVGFCHRGLFRNEPIFTRTGGEFRRFFRDGRFRIHLPHFIFFVHKTIPFYKIRYSDYIILIQNGKKSNSFPQRAS